MKLASCASWADFWSDWTSSGNDRSSEVCAWLQTTTDDVVGNPTSARSPYTDCVPPTGNHGRPVLSCTLYLFWSTHESPAPPSLPPTNQARHRPSEDKPYALGSTVPAVLLLAPNGLKVSTRQGGYTTCRGCCRRPPPVHTCHRTSNPTQRPERQPCAGSADPTA